ncbi:lipopolysaccharide biosynthesis protein [Terriglobus albidus]|uniref:Lipopolysaccharide biosynthesis protein n=1 Tax=Terriglobus albidus TaxID=1592106 RepID=A0A5B9EAK3_9BACT|nr:Wzz/FepE/Etk N-terminal domain-containing protein [Terriglobus albidus]QEE29183.1 lipopolysaccharide biosynthesis protein [Terriglobus albidus]
MSETPVWVHNGGILWRHRRLLVRVFLIAAACSLTLAFVIPKRYSSTAMIMPPANTNSSSVMIAALAGRALGGGSNNSFSSLAGSLLGTGNTTALYIDLIKSGTISDHLIERFELQKVYDKRYRIDTAKKLARRTSVAEDKKSGVITITVEDSDRVRARDLAQGYLDELNLLLTHTATTSAHQERVFIERRLQTAHTDLIRAQKELSNFSTSHTTIDIKEQTRAMVDAMARVQAELIAEQSSLSSLRQIYGDQNIRVKSAESRIGSLQQRLNSIAGPSNSGVDVPVSNDQPYPALRSLPQLAVPYAELYRNLRIQETLFELLTQQYELSRIEEAKDVPVVSVIDTPGIAEKKSFPPRTLLTLALTVMSLLITAAFLLIRDRWEQIPAETPQKIFLQQIAASGNRVLHRIPGVRR